MLLSKGTKEKNKIKEIKRPYYELGDINREIKTGTFINTGIWANGRLAYSRLDNNGNIIEEDEGMFVQVHEIIKGQNKLCMIRL